MSELLPVEEALDIVLKHIPPPETEVLFIGEATGCILAEDVCSDTDKPAFDNSAMDGFAVRSEDIKEVSEESPVKLRIIGEYSAGVESSIKVEKGTAVKILTGAPLPEGADTVVPVEYTSEEEGFVFIKKPFKKGANIRLKGEDLKKGELVLSKGTELRGYEIGLLCGVNKSVVKVYRKPRVGILSTGDELLELGEASNRISQIRSSNHHMLRSLTESAGGNPYLLGIVPDDPTELLETLKKCYDYDIFITTGGVSMGDKDYVRFLAEKAGIEVKFHKLRIKPAKPVLFGTFGKKGLFFGLPGNPVSCAVAFDLLVYPAIRKMQGAQDIFKKRIKAILTEDYVRRDAKRREFARARLWFENGSLLCKPAKKQQSHMLSSYVGANSYMIIYEGVKELKKGEEVEVLLL